MPIQMTWVVLTESAAARGIRVGRGGIEGTSSKTAKKAAEELEVETSPAEIEIATETETGTGTVGSDRGDGDRGDRDRGSELGLGRDYLYFDVRIYI